MLVISRQFDEDCELWAPGISPIGIKIVDIRGDRVRIGMTADPRVAIHRKEIVDALIGKDERLRSGMAAVYRAIREGRTVPTEELLREAGFYERIPVSHTGREAEYTGAIVKGVTRSA